MSVDEPALHQLVEESEDLHADAMRTQRAALPELADYATETRNEEIDPAGSTSSTPAVVIWSTNSASAGPTC